MTYRIVSIKMTAADKAARYETLEKAIAGRDAHDAEYQPAYGTQVLEAETGQEVCDLDGE